MMALQNHNDFIKNAAEIEKLLKMVSHDWVGLMLDIGSYHVADPYLKLPQTRNMPSHGSSRKKSSSMISILIPTIPE
jgi:hypothetical protein